MIKRGLLTTLFTVAISLLGVSSFAMAPTIRSLPDVTISDTEDNIGTDNNWFVFTNAFQFDSYVQDGDTTLSTLLWTFDEGDPTPGWFAVNNVPGVHIGTVAQAADSPTAAAGHFSGGNNIRTSSGATFRDIVFSPTTTPPFPNPTTSHSAGKVVTFFVADGNNNYATRSILVKTLDNTGADSLSGGTCFDVDRSNQSRIPMDDNTFMTNVVSYTPGGTSGWTVNDPSVAGLALNNATYDSANQALNCTVTAGVASAPKHRINGFTSANDQWLPTSAVDTTGNEIVRTKSYVFCTGQSNPSQLNMIPNMRLRVSQRFAVNSMLECFNHISNFPSTATMTPELRPNNDANNPSVYRVDLFPVNVPAMVSSTQGYSRGFEAYSTADELQENGSLELTESIIGKYSVGCITPSEVLRQVYQVSASDAGNLKIVTSATDYSNSKFIPGAAVGDPATQDTTAGGFEVYAEGTGGVTFDTSAVPTNRYGVGVRDFDNTQYALSAMARVAPNKQYRIRWTLTSSTNANQNPQIRMRARSIGFAWSQKFEIGAANAAGASSNVIAQQAEPGVGTSVPSGVYFMIMHTPMSSEIQASQPNISSQVGFGVNSSSRRDIRLGFDVVDTPGGQLESGTVGVLNAQIFESNLVSD